MAGATATRPGADRRPLLSYLRVQRDADREILAALRGSYARINAELKKLEAGSTFSSAIRRQQILLAQANIQREMAAMWSRIGDTIQQAQAQAAAAAVEGMLDMDLLRSVFPAADADYLLQSARAQASRGLTALDARVSGLSDIPLSDKVYYTKDLAAGKIDEIVNAALATGASAADIARDVRAFIRPDTPGGVKYAAQRLGRTEINNAFHATQVQEAVKTPWVTGVKWNLSGSHPRPDECNDYADSQHFDGGPVGVFKPTEVPGKPHPNCLCYCTPVTPDRDEFVDRFNSGEYDKFLEDEFGLEPLEAAQVLPARAVKEYAWGFNENGAPHYERINTNLRAGKAVPDSSNQVMLGLDRAFDMSDPLSRSTRVWRQVVDDGEGLVDDMVATARSGGLFTDKGFMSTTKTEDILEDFAGVGGGVQLNIRVPAGSRTVHVDDFVDPGSGAYLQDEWLFPRGTQLRLFNPRWNADLNVWEIDAEMLIKGSKPISSHPPALGVAGQIAKLEERIRSEQARGRKNPRLRSVTQENIRKARVEINRLRRSKKS